MAGYPILQKILSLMAVLNETAGMYAPIYAKITAKHVYRSNVDFPPIFGPVTNKQSVPSENTVSFGTSSRLPSFKS